MGASKRVAELYVQSLNSSVVSRPLSVVSTDHGQRTTDKTRFVAVRFGNVLGSSGSVVPIFRKQIEAGGPVTVTHPEMRRYFMTIPEASQLVMQAGAIGAGGEIFVLNMGEPIRILDLAGEMIRRAGLVPDQDIQILISGMRPGEKLYEELACDTEQTRPTSHKKIHVWQLPTANAQQLRRMLDMLSGVIDADRDSAVRALMQCVPEFAPAIAPATVAVESPLTSVEVTTDQASRLRLLARAANRAA
jgi:FlaA1/EpsC-like NDP-sugar epimerase